MSLKPSSPSPAVVRGVVSLSLALGLVWVSSPLLSAQKSNHAEQVAASNIQKESYSRSHLRLVNLAILRYAMDNDGVFPALDSPTKFRSQLQVYRVSSANLICSVSGQPYGVNGKLAGKKRSTVAQPSKTLLMWSPRPMPGGEYLIMDVNGSVKRISGGEFGRMRRN